MFNPNQSPRTNLQNSIGSSRGTSPVTNSNNAPNFGRPSVPTNPTNYYQPTDLRSSNRNEYKSDIEKLMDRIHQLEQINDQIHMQIHELRMQNTGSTNQSAIDNYENRIVMLTTEIERVQNQLGKSDKTQLELENKVALMSTEFERIKAQLNTQTRELGETVERNGQLSRDIASLHDENQRLKRQLLENSRAPVPAKDPSLQNKLALLTTEIERLNHQVKTLKDDNISLKAELAQKDAQLDESRYNLGLFQNNQEEKEKLRQSLRAQSDEVELLKTTISRLEKQDDWKTKYFTLQSKKNDLERNWEMLISENERVSNQVKYLQEQIQNHTQRYSNMENLLHDLPQLQAEKADLQNENANLQDQIDKLLDNTYSAQGAEERIKELEAKVMLLANEIERLHATIRELYEKIDVERSRANNLEDTLSQYTDMDRENKDLAILINQRTKQAEQARNNFQKLNESFEYFKSRVNDLNREFEKSQLELNKVIQDQQKTIQEQRDEYFKLQQLYDNLLRSFPDEKAYEQQIADLERIIRSLELQIQKLDDANKDEKKRNEDLRNMLQKSENARREAEHQLELKRTLEVQIESLKKELDDYRDKNNSLQKEISNLRVLELRVRDLELNNQNLNNYNNELLEKIRNLSLQLESSITKMEEYEREVVILRIQSNKVQPLETDLDQLKKENTELKFELQKWKNKDKGYLQLLEQFNNLLAKFVLTTAEVESLRGLLSPKPEEEKPKEQKRNTVNYHTTNPDTLIKSKKY